MFVSSLFRRLAVLRRCLEYAAANQLCHVVDVAAAHLIRHTPYAQRAGHRLSPVEQLVARADQARIEKHRIELSEFTGRNPLLQQLSLEMEDRLDERA